jgi:hypothetical protein
MRLSLLVCVVAVAATVLSGSAAARSNVPIGWMYAGQKAEVGVGIPGLNPLRNCPLTSCTVIAWMPASTGFNPGQGWVTSVIDQPWLRASWCEINWKQVIGWTGCWRLAPLL